MFIEWIIKIFKPKPPTNLVQDQTDCQTELTRLEEKRKDILTSKENIKSSSSDWYKIDFQILERKNKIEIFKPYSFKNFKSFKNLLEEHRIEEERIKIGFENFIINHLNKVSLLISDKNVAAADNVLKQLAPKISKTTNKKILELYHDNTTQLLALKTELIIQKQKKVAEQERQKALIAQKLKKEAEEKAKIDKERLEEEKREKERLNKLYLENLKKEEDEKRCEKDRLDKLNNKLKSDSEEISNYLKNNRILYFYHFTDRKNILSIKKHGGLYSWEYCSKHNMKIPAPGGDSLSRNLDSQYKLQDYVRLSFCKEHPMKFVAEKDGRIENPVILKIDPIVATLHDTLFSDMNATKTGHRIGKDFEDLKNVHFDIIRASSQFAVEHEDRKYYQAEVLVKTWIPTKYILNINQL